LYERHQITALEQYRVLLWKMWEGNNPQVRIN